MMAKLKKGFYKHYKHDPKGVFGNYVYEVMNLADHTERRDEVLVVYRALYESSAYKEGKHFDARPYGMFTEDVVVDGISRPRFQMITDTKEVRKCEALRDKMYRGMSDELISD